MLRKFILENNHLYHVFSRSIANYEIFNDVLDYERMLYSLMFYQIKEPPTSLSKFLKTEYVRNFGFDSAFKPYANNQQNIIQIVGYCLMPTHIHLILKQLKKNGISIFMGNVLNSYSRYFNLRHHRKGPLWESKFKNILVLEDEQLLHLIRYIHLNPVTAFLVDKPEDWKFSSYKEFIDVEVKQPICQFDDLIEMKPKAYRNFVEERINYQRELAKIKNLLID